MQKQTIISVTLLVSALAFNNSLVAEQHTDITINTQLERISTTSHIASILYEKGLDEDAAQVISQNLIIDDALFTTMIENLLNGCSNINKDDAYEYLSKAALQRQKVRLDNYGHLIHMVSTIKQKALDKGTLAQLNIVAKQNTSLLI